MSSNAVADTFEHALLARAEALEQPQNAGGISSLIAAEFRTLADEIHRMVNWQDYPCIETDWTRHPRGYGRKYAGKAPNGNSVYVKSHRVALEEKLGRPLRPGMNANHHCDNPPCIQPEHLYEGTQEQNVQDACNRGRRPWVPAVQRAEIQRRYAAGGISHEALSAELGISESAVAYIIHGRPDRRKGER